ncbi:hypothetical protein [Amycolatopsis benzoatilytica]|nr:hypothetical protein [Amycolatopsis benzoatilytica]
MRRIEGEINSRQSVVCPDEKSEMRLLLRTGRGQVKQDLPGKLTALTCP